MLADLNALQGLLNPGIGDALYHLARECPSGLAIVEIGSFRGKSTAFLAAGGRDGHGAKVTAVDPWDLPGNPYGKHGYSAPEVREAFEAQLRSVGLWSRVTARRAFSADAAAAWSGRKIGLLYIDGDHTEEGVRADVDAWAPHLAPGGVMAFDDYNTRKNPGVKTVVDSLGAATIHADHLAVIR
jgi:predicted O-methyltransferase YrrM